jgi:hypothetical protein
MKEYTDKEIFDKVMSNFNPEFLLALVERLIELEEFTKNPDLLLKLSEGVFYYPKEAAVILSPEQRRYLNEHGNIELDKGLTDARER